MRVGIIGDIVGKPGREMIKSTLHALRAEFALDFVIANYENVSHGFGLIKRHADMLFDAGVDLLTGGNHSFDKRELLDFIDNRPIIRPLNFPKDAPGKGVYRLQKDGIAIAVINLMGHYMMPLCDNPFTLADAAVEELIKEGFGHIFVDMHAETTAEKATLYHLLKERVSAVWGTHTHVGTDDLIVSSGSMFVTDIGLTGCMDEVIGMQKDAPLSRALTGVGSAYNIPKQCKQILQMVVVDIDRYGKATSAQKIKIIDKRAPIIFDAITMDA